MSIDLPKSCVLLNRIEIIEYLGEDGEIQKFEVSETSDGSEMPLDRALLLLEWCKAKHLAPMIAGIIAEDICDFDDEDADDAGD